MVTQKVVELVENRHVVMVHGVLVLVIRIVEVVVLIPSLLVIVTLSVNDQVEILVQKMVLHTMKTVLLNVLEVKRVTITNVKHL
jgi:hypothetical protein